MNTVMNRRAREVIIIIIYSTLKFQLHHSTKKIILFNAQKDTSRILLLLGYITSNTSIEESYMNFSNCVNSCLQQIHINNVHVY